jgi:hypothetical protein
MRKPGRKIIIPEKDKKRIQTEGLVQITEHLNPKEYIESGWGRIRQGTWLIKWADQVEADQTAKRTAIIVTEADGRQCLYATPAPDLRKFDAQDREEWKAPRQRIVLGKRKTCRVCGDRLSHFNKTGQCYFHSEPPDKRSSADISGKAEEMEG